MPKRRLRPRLLPRARAAAVTRYAPASRLHELRTLLDAHEGVSIYDVAERFAVNPRTALRYIQALQRAGEPLYEEMSGKRKVWRLSPIARRQKITLTTRVVPVKMIALPVVAIAKRLASSKSCVTSYSSTIRLST